MSKWIDFARAFFVSPEMLLAVFFVFISTKFPDVSAFIGRAFNSNDNRWDMIAFVPLGFAAYSVNLTFKLRAPMDGNGNKVLYEWPKYYLVVNRCYVSIIWVVVTSLMAMGVALLSKSIPDLVVGVMFLSCSLISGVVTISFVISVQRIKEIVERYAE